jgi:hypothetical protein
MRIFDKRVLEQVSAELSLLCSDMLELEASLLKRPLVLHEAHRRSARNLAHYLALRRHDIRPLQSQLALLGLSSLGRTESHALTAVQTVHRVQWDGSKRNIEQARAVMRSHIARILHSAKATTSLLLR